MRKFFTLAIASILSVLCCVNYAAAKKAPVPLERKNYETLAPPGGPFSHAVRHGNVLYLSGITAYGTTAQGKSMAEQAQEIWVKIGAIARAEGTDLRSLIKVTMFITDFSQAPALREELARQYNGQFPASSLVEVNKLFAPEVNIEIEAILGL